MFKIHGLADDRGRPVAFGLTPGNKGFRQSITVLGAHADMNMALPLLEQVTPPKRVVVDKPVLSKVEGPQDADRLRCRLAEHRIKAVVPFTAIRTVPYSLDQRAYQRRNRIERTFRRLKNWRRVATRYDRLARNRLAGQALAAVVSEGAEQISA